MRQKISFILLLGVFAAIGFFVSAIVSCPLDNACSNTEQYRVASPKGDLTAVVFERSCGATTGFSTQVSILDSGKELPDESGNLFIADTDHGEAPAASWGGPLVEIVWEGDDVILLKHHARARIFKHENRHGDVSVVYAIGGGS